MCLEFYYKSTVCDGCKDNQRNKELLTIVLDFELLGHHTLAPSEFWF